MMHLKMNTLENTLEALNITLEALNVALGHFVVVVDLMVRSVGKEAETIKEMSTSN